MEGGADGGHFGVEVVHVMEDEGFADHGEFGRAELVFAVVADEDVLDYRFQVGGKADDGVHSVGYGFQFHDDVAEELAFVGVGDGAVVAEFIEFADIVEHGGHQKKIDIKLGIVRGDLFGQAAETDDVFEQAADVGVVHAFGGRGALQAFGDGRRW